MAADRDTHRFVELGQRLFGDDWHGKMARMTAFSRPYITMLAKGGGVEGGRPVTDAVKAAVKKGLRAEIKRLRGRAVEVEKLLKEYK